MEKIPANSGRISRIELQIATARQRQHELRLQAALYTASIESLDSTIWDLKEALEAEKEK